ncbi:4-hydroxy-tetrahydrodipicolinate reductase [Candidatus Aerophobetes bacterium]|nr:4-hydroxy-tetrahydrodipicolinate reductase [Candidatus Aerophobetes bacterium]
MNKIKVIVCGARGRMGRELVSALEGQEGFQLIGIVEAPSHPEVGMEISKGLRVVSHLEEVFQQNAVVIDFTTPQATIEHLHVAKENHLPCVIGTTGFSSLEIEKIKQISSTIPILLSPNMGIGVNLLFVLVKKIGEVLQDFDKEIVEAHHNMKQDAPSGTAHKIAQILAEVEGKDLSDIATYGRKGITGKRKQGEIGIHSIRGGSIVGEHRVIFAGEGEVLEITHRAESRRIFARGALLAARFIVGKRPGLYDLQDALGIER